MREPNQSALEGRIAELEQHSAVLAAGNAQLYAEVEALRAKINTPHTKNFAEAVVLEAVHQRDRWGSAHDAGKAPEDWFWLLGYLIGKALHAAKAGDTEKALHHTISSAAALANWHAALSGPSTDMRPGIDPVARGIEDAAIAARKGEGE